MSGKSVLVLDEVSLAKVLKALADADLKVLAHANLDFGDDPLPKLAELVAKLRPAQGPELGAPPQGIQISAVDEVSAPQASLAPWRKALAQLGGSLDIGAREPLPAAIGKSAPVLEVLNSAGEQGVVDIDGERYGAYGWPDLRRSGAKVLLLGAGEPLAEVIALHRLPARHGICRRGGGLLPSTGRMGRTSVEVTGEDYPDNGRLFAVDHDAIFVMDGQCVHRWDGRRQTAQGSPSACMASLMLTWSQK
ncbi:MAG: hypothetical protein ACI9VR_000266 [Cognaticolwellia sp.]|jgi:hypothetical protein